MGLGKTELFAALLIAGNASEAYRVRLRGETAATGINAVAVPSQLGAYMTEKLHDTLDVDWRVYRLGHHKQLYEETNTKRRIKIGGQEVPWSESDADTPPSQRRVSVITYEQISLLGNLARREGFIGDDLTGSNSDDLWQNLFRRMICDEGHGLRRFDETLRGKNARRFAPKYRHVVPGTPILRTARDFRGTLRWSSVRTGSGPTLIGTRRRTPMATCGRTVATIDTGKRPTADRCKMADRLPDETHFVDAGDDWRPNVRGRIYGCENYETARGRLLNTGVNTD
ncbi:hypothetical protein KC354_g15844 [Hortaea werneckii]|nr:hypothetical protein KC354_g15844 [Hortaea werneckii]